MRNKNCPVLPILGFYLTFIHYFGFSINPAARSSKCAPDPMPLDTHLRPTKRRVQLSDWKPTPERHRPQTSSADCRRRVQLAGLLQSVVKFTAISFTTFIAANHCLVLADYIYQGNKAYEELMFDARLVLTKLSALIFVLSWHRNQAKVRRLIRMVKSTNIYVSGTYRSDERPPMSSTGNFLWLQGPQFIVDQLQAKRGAYLGERLESNETRTGSDWRQPLIGGDSAQIGHYLHNNTSRIDRSVLSWWFMCVFVIILHFLLSEAELTNSHHLWQWLDDYSMHQLSNKTTSSSTLMFLASFDNYIYTVHVYGTRLIGASIICIVCSLQHENIENLRWHTLQLLKTSSELCACARARQSGLASKSSPSSVQHLSSGGCLSNNSANSRYNDQNCNCANNQQRQQGESNQDMLFMGDTDSNGSCSRAARFQSLPMESASRQASGHEVGGCSDLLGNDISCLADCDLFFIIGESNWLKVRENVARLRPCGYLSLSLWQAKCLLLLQATRYFGLWRRICMRLLRSLHDMKFIMASDDQSHRTNSTTQAVSPQLAPSRRVTPTLNTCELTFGQVASTLMAADCQCKLATPIGHLYQQQDWRQLESTSTAAASSDLFCRGQLNSSAYLEDYLRLRAGESSKGRINIGDLTADLIEWQLEGLASKYELVRTVNANIDSCFGPMLLIQYSFLFLMSCIDVVYFSIYFNPNTKTKYIIISGMILLWWPYLLLYKFASDLGSSSKELLISVRRLARLSLIEYHSKARKEATTSTTGEPALTSYSHKNSLLSFVSSFPKDKCNKLKNNADHTKLGPTLLLGHKSYLSRRANGAQNSDSSTIGSARIRVINKLDHVFKPTNLSIIGIMTIDKFFLLNFAKIVITASVMIIQFISHQLDG